MLIETERLVLTRFTTDDAPFYMELVNSPGWLKNIGDRGIRTIEDAKKYLKDIIMNGYVQNDFGVWKVSLKTDGTPIGLCGLIKRDTLGHVDIGFALLPEYEGQGYAYEAAVATIVEARAVWKLDKIVAITLAENARSVKLLEKLGLQFEKMVRLPGDPDELVLMGMDL